MGARAFSYALRSMDVPDEPVRVELEAPSGGTWEWGPAETCELGHRNCARLLPGRYEATPSIRHSTTGKWGCGGPVDGDRPGVRRAAGSGKTFYLKEIPAGSSAGSPVGS